LHEAEAALNQDCKCKACRPDAENPDDMCINFDRKGICKNCGIDTTAIDDFYLNRLGFCEVCLW
jgi:hypothetical protein